MRIERRNDRFLLRNKRFRILLTPQDIGTVFVTVCLAGDAAWHVSLPATTVQIYDRSVPDLFRDERNSWKPFYYACPIRFSGRAEHVRELQRLLLHGLGLELVPRSLTAWELD